eukprot:363332-Chlamydomonas_euryale.AAC.3
MSPAHAPLALRQLQAAGHCAHADARHALACRVASCSPCYAQASPQLGLPWIQHRFAPSALAVRAVTAGERTETSTIASCRAAKPRQ